MKILLPLLFISSYFVQLHANAKTEHHLAALEEVLTVEVIKKFISKSKTKTVVALAMDEDLDADYPNNYLLSDDMLGLLDKDGVLSSPFTKEIEAFQTHVDSLKDPEEKALAISAWKSLWLDKVSEYQVYLKGLKKLFTWDLSQGINYDSNIKVEDNDDVNSGASDTGASFAGGLNFRPFINIKKNTDWRYTMRVNGMRTYQQDEDDLQYDYVTWSNKLTYINLSKNIPTLSFNLSSTYGYNQGSAPRYEYNQWALGSSMSFKPFSAEKITFGHFKSAINQASLRYRRKDEVANGGTPQIDVDIVTLSYGQMYTQVAKTQPFQMLGWNLALESQTIGYSLQEYRDYTSFKLGAYYIRDISSLIENSNLTWNTRASIRLKDWDSHTTANEEEDEEEYFISTSVSNSWTDYFSSSLGVSYRKRNQGLYNAGGNDIDQWRFVLNNTLISL